MVVGTVSKRRRRLICERRNPARTSSFRLTDVARVRSHLHVIRRRHPASEFHRVTSFIVPAPPQRRAAAGPMRKEVRSLSLHRNFTTDDDDDDPRPEQRH